MRVLFAVISVASAMALSFASAAEPSEAVSVEYSMADAHRGAQFRAEASIVIPIIFHPCGGSPAMQPLSARYRDFHAGLDNLHQKIDLEIARADFGYQMALADIVCPDPDAPETLEREKLNILFANSVLDRMDRLVKPVSGQDN